MSTDRLFVLWTKPEEQRRAVVGELWRDATGVYKFAYIDDAMTLVSLRRGGFRMMAEFPDYRTRANPYQAAQLFPTFAQRIPSPKRPDYRGMMSGWGVERPDDLLDVLAHSGGILATDRIELAEWRPENDELCEPLLFRLAGEMFFYDAAKSLRVGDQLAVRLDDDNKFDECATLVLSNGQPVGYLPRQYSRFVSRLLSAQVSLLAKVVRRLIVPEDRGRWVICLSRTQA